MGRNNSRSPKQRLTSVACTGVIAFVASSQTIAQLGSPTLPPPSERETVDRNHVDLMSGAISLTIPLLAIGDEATGLQLIDYYNSQGAMRDSYGGMLTLTSEGAQFAVHASWGNSAWTFPDQTAYSLSGDGASVSVGQTTSVVTLHDGTVLTYSILTPQASCPIDETCQTYYFPTQAVRPNGLTISLNYRTYVASNGFWNVRVQSVTNNAGYQIKYNYSSNDPTSSVLWQTVSSAVAVNNGVEYCNPTADTCTFANSWPTATYSGNAGSSGFTITDALGRSTRFTYAGTSIKVKTAASATDNLQYTTQSFISDPGLNAYRVVSATIGADTWGYSYVQTPANLAPYNIVLTRSDPQNHQTIFTSQRTDVMSGTPALDEMWTVTSIKNALNRITSYGYPCSGSAGAPQAYPYFNTSAFSVTLPEANATNRACDARGNVTSVTLIPKTGSGPNNITNSWTFPTSCANPKICNQPTAFIDGRGFETDYTYDPTHGGLMTEMKPAVNAVRATKRYSYSQIYAYVKNSSGALVQAATPVWMPTQVAECRTANSCAGTADETVTSYEYAAAGSVNRLLARGKTVTPTLGASLRTCYAYDSMGNRSSVTTPRAGLSTCP